MNMERCKKSFLKSNVFPLLFAAGLLPCITACQVQPVNALDYSLEDAMYTGQIPAACVASPDMQIILVESPFSEQPPVPAETPIAVQVIEEQPFRSAQTLPPVSASEDISEPMFRYALHVQDETGTPVVGARATLYTDDQALYSEILNESGVVAWNLSAGAYWATAKLDGYTEAENNSAVFALSGDITATIVLRAVAQPAPTPDETKASLLAPVVTPAGSPEISATPAPAQKGMSTPAGTSTPIFTPVPVMTAVPMPAPYYGGKVVITAPDITVKSGNTAFSLMDGVSAADESRNTVAVWVVSDDWFNSNIAGTYTVIYASMQGAEMIYAARAVTVEGTTTQSSPKVSAPEGNSEERYKRLLKYRNEIYDELAPHMQNLSAQLRSYAASFISDTNGLSYLKETAFGEDGSKPEDASADNAFTAVSYTRTNQIEISNWSDILSVFIAKNSAVDVEDPLDLMELRNISWSGLDSVFRDMIELSILETDTGTAILYKAKTYAEMSIEYAFNEKQNNLLYTLMQPEFQRVFASLTGNTAFNDPSEDAIASALSGLPKDLSMQREAVVETAYSLVGRLHYFWGGKHNAIGWNDAWGLPKIVMSEDSKTAGTERAYGLDCSGFVSWVFINAAGDVSVLDVIGNGSTNQWNHARSIGWDEGQPGDLAFMAVPGERDVNHVGIVVAVNEDGSYLVAHCSSLRNDVVVTDAWSSGFRYLRKPILYD